MSDPYATLGLSPDSSDEAIRRRYLTLIRTHSPERDPDRFAEIRQAYDKLRDPVTRLRYRLFEAGKEDSLEAIISEAKAHLPRPRVALQTLLSIGRSRL